MTLTAFALLGYLIGSVSFAVLMSRAFGLADPRSYGSGNPGATNVLRSGNKLAAVLTLLGDSIKGWLAVWLTQRYALVDVMEHAMALAGLAVIVGHMFPLFHRFKGGKGVATAVGVLFGFNLYMALGAAATWIIMVVFFRISSLASITAAAFAPVAALILYHAAHPFFISVLISALLLIYRHRSNIRNLMAGKERRLGSSSKD